MLNYNSGYIITRMKAVWIAIISLCTVVFTSILIFSLNRYSDDKEITLPIIVSWIVCLFIILLILFAFRQASKLGVREDKLREYNDRRQAIKNSNVISIGHELPPEFNKPKKWHHWVNPFFYLKDKNDE